MSWYTVAAAGGRRDLWVRATGPGAPPYGRWISPAGHDVRKALSQRGPNDLDVDVRWEQAPEHPGDRLTGILWETGMLGLKVLSQEMLEILQAHGARLETFADIEVRLASGELVEGYVGVLEDTENPGPVHSLWRGKRSHRLVVSGDVRGDLERARLAGLEFEPVEDPFPADQPGFFED